MKNNIKKNIFFIITAVLSLAIFVILAIAVKNDRLYGFDQKIYSLIEPMINSGNTLWVRIVTNLGGSTALIALTAALLLIPKTRKKFGLPLTLILLLSSAANMLVKYIFARERPDIRRLIEVSFYDGYSFPSGHAMIGLAYYGGIILLVWAASSKKMIALTATIMLTLLVLLIGLSRIYLGVHYASDVLAGFALGLCMLSLFYLIIDRLKEKKRLIY